MQTQPHTQTAALEPYARQRTRFDVVIAEYHDLPADAHIRPCDMIIRIERAS